MPSTVEVAKDKRLAILAQAFAVLLPPTLATRAFTTIHTCICAVLSFCAQCAADARTQAHNVDADLSSDGAGYAEMSL